MLLDGGAKVNAVFEDYDWRGCGSQNTAFQLALDLSMHTSDAELLSLFLKHGGDPNTECVRDAHTMRYDGKQVSRPLHNAVSRNNLEIVKVLLDGGADVNAHYTNRGQSEYGSAENTKETSLHCACSRGYYPIVELLLKHGANINEQRDFLENIRREVSSPTRDPRDPGYVSGIELKPLKETSLHLAILNNHPEVVSLLILNGADISIPRVSGDQEESVYELCKTPEMGNAISIGWNPKIHYLHLKEIRDAIKTLLLCAHNQHWGFPQDVLYLVFDYVARAFI